MLVPYRMARVTSFLDPWADPFNSGFQLTQSLIAIGRGEWFGVGLGESVQKLFYLPEAHTDFLFAVLAEELGLVGVAVTLALFIALVWRSFLDRAAGVARRPAVPGLLAAGFGLWLGVQAFDQHRREHGRAADQGADAAAHELRPLEHDRHARAGSACCCACITRPCRARAAWRVRAARGRARRGAGRRMSAPSRTDPHHGRRHRRPRVSGARARAPAARRVARGRLARHAARPRSARRAGGEHRDRVARR